MLALLLAAVIGQPWTPHHIERTGIWLSLPSEYVRHGERFEASGGASVTVGDWSPPPGAALQSERPATICGTSGTVAEYAHSTFGVSVDNPMATKWIVGTFSLNGREVRIACCHRTDSIGAAIDGRPEFSEILSRASTEPPTVNAGAAWLLALGAATAVGLVVVHFLRPTQKPRRRGA